MEKRQKIQDFDSWTTVYSCVTVAFQLCYRCVTVVLQLRYRCVTVALQLPYNCFAVVFQLRCSCVADALQLPYNCVTVVQESEYCIFWHLCTHANLVDAWTSVHVSSATKSWSWSSLSSSRYSSRPMGTPRCRELPRSVLSLSGHGEEEKLIGRCGCRYYPAKAARFVRLLNDNVIG